MENNTKQLPAKLPTLQELSLDPEVAFKNDAFKLLLNSPPKERWIKTNPYANNSKDIPIDKVEMLLDTIFQRWKVSVLNTGTMFNAVYVHIRLEYVDPVTGEWMHHDGVGAKEVQVDSGSKASDMSSIKASAVTMALPIAKSLAIKDAADHLGKIFGRDLNRKDTIEFKPAYTEAAKNAQQEMKEKLSKS